jgi:phosphoesterase RecJ-like protein
VSHHHHHSKVAGEAVGADRVAELLSGPARKVVVTTHRKPDGDAAGSMIAMARILRGLGHDVVMWHVEGPGLPDHLTWLLEPGETVVSGPVDDRDERIVVSVDAATSHRVTDDDPCMLGEPIINIDHHHDNPLWGHFNLVDGQASSTAEMVVRVADALGVSIDEHIALPLYVGLVTDTGRFSYANTGAEAHVVAARLIDAGVEPAVGYRRLFEGVPFGDMRLFGRAVASSQAELGGRFVVAVITDDDVAAAGGTDSDGVAEALRAVEGAEVSAVIRQVPGGWRVSSRASGDAIDVSAIAALEGGGGHRAAAGFSTEREPDEIIRMMCEAIEAQHG